MLSISGNNDDISENKNIGYLSKFEMKDYNALIGKKDNLLLSQ